MEEIKQNMSITFRDGSNKEYLNYAQHMLGNGFIQVLTEDAAYIHPSDLIQEIIVTQGE
jgi:hypothetical protein